MADDNANVVDLEAGGGGDGVEDPWQDPFHDYCVDGVVSCLYGGDTERGGVDGDGKTEVKIPSMRDRLPDCDTLTFLRLLLSGESDETMRGSVGGTSWD